jgi:hypothetical protein
VVEPSRHVPCGGLLEVRAPVARERNPTASRVANAFLEARGAKPPAER